jgi:hypothetical protein
MKRTLLFILLLTPLMSWCQADEEIGTSIKKKYKDVGLLAEALLEDAVTDQQKANAAFNYVTKNIEHFIKDESKDKNFGQAEQVLSSKKATPKGYANLLSSLFTELELKNVIISGYSRDWKHDDGDSFFRSHFYWNAVRIGNEWHYVDGFNGAGKTVLDTKGKKKKSKDVKLKFVKEYNPKCFMESPKGKRLTYLCDDPMWQLTEEPMPLSVFMAGEDAVTAYNEKSQIKRIDNKLNDFADKDIFAQIEDSEPRVIAFNPRNNFAICEKYYQNGRLLALKIISKKTRDDAVSKLDEAINSLDRAKEFMMKSQADESGNLQYHGAKNQDKKKHAAEFQKELEALNKSVFNDINMRTRLEKSNEGKIAGNARTVAAAIKASDKDNFGEIVTMPSPMKSDAKEAMQLKDSVAARDKRITAGKEAVRNLESKIDNMLNTNERLATSLETECGASISIMRDYANNKANYLDHYDTEVKGCEEQLRASRVYKLDSMQKKYLRTIDTLALSYNALIEQHKANAKDLMSNMKDAQNYKKRVGGNEPIVNNYNKYMKDYEQALTSQTNVGEEWSDFHKEVRNELIRQTKSYESLGKLLVLTKEFETSRFGDNKALLSKEGKVFTQNTKASRANIANFTKSLRNIQKEIRKEQAKI